MTTLILRGEDIGQILNLFHGDPELGPKDGNYRTICLGLRREIIF